MKFASRTIKGSPSPVLDVVSSVESNFPCHVAFATGSVAERRPDNPKKLIERT